MKTINFCYFTYLSILLFGCSKSTIQKKDENLPPKVAGGSNDNDSTNGRLSIAGLELKQLGKTLPGADVRLLKVIPDNQGNFIVSLVSDIVGKKQAPDGFLILKIDESGNELWRWPAPALPGSASSVEQKFAPGLLTDVSLGKDGVLWLMGVTSIRAPATGINLLSGLPWATTTFSKSNNVFFQSISAASKNQWEVKVAQPRIDWSVPTWWTPVSLQSRDDGNIQIESRSGYVHFTQQIQIFNPHFFSNMKPESHIASTCFISGNRLLKSRKIALVASAAPAESVDAMTAAFSFNKNETDDKVSEAQLNQNEGRCWDMLQNRVMPAEGNGFHIMKPSLRLATNQRPTYDLQKIAGLLNGMRETETSKILSEFPSDFTNDQLEMIQTERTNSSFGIGFEFNEELCFAGQDNSEFKVSNFAENLSKKWFHSLKTNKARLPGAADAVVSGEDFVLAWVENELPGETDPGNRLIRLMHFNQSTNKSSTELKVDKKIARTLSSVKVTKSLSGKLILFSTAGSSANTASGNEVLTSSVLMMGAQK